MMKRELRPESEEALERALGYLNFSSGASDPQFLAALDRLSEQVAEGEEAPWSVVLGMLRDKLRRLQQQSPAFQDASQAERVLDLVEEQVLPGYLAFHGDLLFHQDAGEMVNAFFLGRVVEVVLRQGPAWEDAEQISRRAITQLNDYIGYRPLPTLQRKRMDPYPHEFVRPVPLYVRGAGVVSGRYRQVVALTLELLNETDEDLLRSAYFDPAALEELAYDPRAYDFDHPVNKRPNYHFGQWDPHVIDNQGRYRRFVIQQVTLDALMARLVEAGELPAEEVIFEAAAVLAGTMLMAAGISGSGPATHDSSTNLATLLPRIADYRDAFYERLFQRMSGAHAQRLLAEAAQLQQPFGGARQHLNAQLARQRATQLEHIHLAQIFARMGYPKAAAKLATVVPVAAARMRCQVECRLTAAMQLLEAGELSKAAKQPAEIMDVIRRGIACGAFIDPWNILGFDAQFSLFPALENSVHDHRADELVAFMTQVLALYTYIWSEAAARDDQAVCERMRAEFEQVADWWRQYALHEVASVEAVDPWEVFEAGEVVAKALNLWHKASASAGDVAFWAPHAALFDSPQAYTLVISALLDRKDFVASLALLVHWLSRADELPLEQADTSFHQLAERWLMDMLRAGSAVDKALGEPERWKLIRRFFDFLEANAEEYWVVPQFELGDPTVSAQRAASGEDESEEGEESDLFRAAYEGVVYQDSTDDGIDNDMLMDFDQAARDELVLEFDRLNDRLTFLGTVARLWKAVAISQQPDQESEQASEQLGTMRRWEEQSAENYRQLAALMEAVRKFSLQAAAGDHDSMVEYDRRRLIKESLLERIIATCVETADAYRFVRAANGTTTPADESLGLGDDDSHFVTIIGALLQRDVAVVREAWDDFLLALHRHPLLYVPLARGGNPHSIVTIRVRQRGIQDLLGWLPRLGLLGETCQLIETARHMERNHFVGPGAVTEFDELFKIGYRSIVESLVLAAQQQAAAPVAGNVNERDPQRALVGCVERLTESLLISWLAHSRTLRLSVLERVKDAGDWNKLVRFIKKYGRDLFTQRFLNLGNLRAILHQGVQAWLTQLEKDPREHAELKLLHDLDKEISHGEAVKHLSVILEAIVEHYAEYRDYNSTTTQSDRGDLLHMLLDFLRLRTRYERIVWNLKPVVLAHEILVRRGQERAAQMWRRALAHRTADEANQYLNQLRKLQEKYAMRMPTIADRLGERFVKPMTIDRIRALVEPAIQEARQPGRRRHFQQLRKETSALVREPTGAGFEPPEWLVALEEEVERARRPAYRKDDLSQLTAMILPRVVSFDEAERQVEVWCERNDEE